MGSSKQRRDPRRAQSAKFGRGRTSVEPRKLRGPQQNALFPVEGMIEGLDRLAEISRTTRPYGPRSWWGRAARWIKRNVW
jgi:hypothetical protein